MGGFQYDRQDRARGVVERWDRLRSNGRGDEADAEKDAYCLMVDRT